VYFCEYFDLTEGNYWRSYMMGMNKTNLYMEVTGEFRLTGGLSNNQDVEFGVRYTSKITATDRNGSVIYDENNKPVIVSSNDTLKVFCPKHEAYCDTNRFLLYPQLDYIGYLLEVHFEIDDSLLSITDAVRFAGSTQNPPFTDFLLYFRYSFTILSFIGLLLYCIHICRAPGADITFEHRMILALSVFLVLFNDPLFAATLFRPSSALAVVSTLFVTLFASSLVVFWMVMYRRIVTEVLEKNTKQCGWVSYIFGLILFCILSVASGLRSVYARFEPGVHPSTSLPLVSRIFNTISISLAIIIVFYFIYYTYKISAKWHQVIKRQQVFFRWSILFVILLVGLTFAGLYQSYDLNNVHIVMLFLMFNFYVLTLQFLWRFTDGKVKKPVEKKNEKTTSYDKAKEQIGMRYFDCNTDVELARTEVESPIKVEDPEYEPFEDEPPSNLNGRDYVAFGNQTEAEPLKEADFLESDEKGLFDKQA